MFKWLAARLYVATFACNELISFQMISKLHACHKCMQFAMFANAMFLPNIFFIKLECTYVQCVPLLIIFCRLERKGQEGFRKVYDSYHRYGKDQSKTTSLILRTMISKSSSTLWHLCTRITGAHPYQNYLWKNCIFFY